MFKIGDRVRILDAPTETTYIQYIGQEGIVRAHDVSSGNWQVMCENGTWWYLEKDIQPLQRRKVVPLPLPG